MYAAHSHHRLALLRPYSGLALSIPAVALAASLSALFVSLDLGGTLAHAAWALTGTSALACMTAAGMLLRSATSKALAMALSLLSVALVTLSIIVLGDLTGPERSLYFLLLILFTISFQHREAALGMVATTLGYMVTLPVGRAALPSPLGEAVAFSVVALLLNTHSARDTRLKRYTVRDSLTGVYRRSVFMNSLCDTLRRSQVTMGNVALLFVDLDNFKAMNESLGHLGGDDVLRRVGQLMTANVRASDYVGRWGGDEFVIVIPDLPASGVSVIAERLRSAVEEHFCAAEHITVSIGVCGISGGCEPEALLARADSALYGAKHQGRNRVVFA